MFNFAPTRPGKVRITHVIRSFGAGTVAALLDSFTRHADRSRYDHRVVCLGDRTAAAEAFSACGWSVECLELPNGPGPELIRRLSQLLVRGRTDVLHTHNDSSLIYAGPAARFAGVRRVVHSRHRVAGVMRPSNRTLVRFASLLTNRIVCVSENSRYLSQIEGIPSRKITVIRSGIDPDRYPYLGPLPGGPVVTIDEFASPNGVDTLLKAAAMVVRRRTEFRLDIAGDGPARPEVEALAATLGLQARVRFLGRVRTDKMSNLLGRASAVYCPSTGDGYSPVLLRAMASGLPVVGIQSGTNPEMIEEGLNGRLVPAGDVDALTRVLSDLWPGSDVGNRMSRAGRERVLKLFDARSTIREYEAVYHHLGRRYFSSSSEKSTAISAIYS